MAIHVIDGDALKKLFVGASQNLTANKELIDAMNVFPVPDGDTGTNMCLTMQAAVNEVLSTEQNDVSEIAKAASAGALRGARGNSGVILSQLIRGFAKGLANHIELTPVTLADAFSLAIDMAYKAVMKPKEGTIITVAKACSHKASEMALETDDFEVFGKEILNYGHSVLAHTKEMLPVLKQADVVDAGGKGLMCILEGAFSALFEDYEIDFSMLANMPRPDILKQEHMDMDIEFAYCTEFFIELSANDYSVEDNMKIYLQTIGDSAVVVLDENICKIHVHTNNPGLVLEKALNYGSLSNLKIENMRLQHSETLNLQTDIQKTEKEVGFVSIVTGKGFEDIFKKLFVDEIIEGGQTMNPSTEDIIGAINKVNAKNVFVFPNNKNIIMAAELARDLCKEKNVIVLPTTTIPQGINAMVAYDPYKMVEDIKEAMCEAIDSIKTALITLAVRDTVIDDKEIKNGDVLGMVESKIVVVENSINSAALGVLEYIDTNNYELLTLYYGEDVKEEDANNLSDLIAEKHSNLDIAVYDGGQLVYNYILSLE